MKFKRKKDKKQGGSSSWMNTYADMITLVLVFFILLFSMSQIDEMKFKTVTQSYRDHVLFDSQPSIVEAEHPSEIGDTLDNADEGEPEEEQTEQEQGELGEGQDKYDQEDSLGQLMQEVNTFLTNEGLGDVITANRTETGVVLVLSEKILFETGEAEIIDEGKPFLDKVGKLLSNIPNNVKVEGHTDNRPISTYRYPSNWELSSARASSVIRYLIDSNPLESSRFQAIGFGDTKPVGKNDTAEDWQKNRRVELIILDETEGA